MLFPFQIITIVAHSLTFVCSQSAIPLLNNSAIELPLSSGGFTFTTSDATSHWSNPGFACINGGIGSPTTRPRLLDCATALFILPQEDAVRTFSSGGAASDIYELPKSFQNGECKITIDLLSGMSTESTSWHRIGLDATRLVLSCNGPSVGTSAWRTGGKVRTGAERGILISVYTVSRPPSQADEDTRGMNGSSIM